MLGSLLWLSPAAQDLLKTASQLLKGKVPCSGADLAAALRSAQDADCFGVVTDATLRGELAALLEKSKGEASAAAAVEMLGTALEAKAKAAKDKAKPVAQKLKGMPGFTDVTAALPKGQEPPELLKKDWLLWHATGCSHYKDQVPALAEAVVKDRLALAACAGEGPAAESVMSLHVLENLSAYVLWETSMSGSKPPSLGLEVKFPFDAAAAEEVAVRRALSTVLPAEAAGAIASDAAKAGKDALEKRVQAALAKRESAAKSAAVFPLYAEPPKPAEPKDKKAKKDGGKADAKGGKADAGAAKGGKVDAAPAPAAAKAAPAGSSASLSAFKKATATQELQWQLLAYKMRPSTTLGAAAGGGGASKQGAGRSGAASASQPKGFAGTWAPIGAALPPGHTEYSWNHAKAEGMKEGFACTWSPSGKDLPPGHTDYSWENVKGAGAPTPSASTGKKQKGGGDKKEKAPAAKAAAAPAVGAAGRDEDDDAAAKIALIVGKVTKVWEHPDSDKLWCEEIDCGEAEPRQIGSGLRAFYKKEEFEGRMVLVVANLKPKKLAGFPSNGMVLCASNADHTDVKFVEVPAGAKPGERVVFGDMPMDPPAEPGPCDKKKFFAKCQPHFNSKGGQAMYKGHPFKLPSGVCTAPVADGYSLS